MTPAELVEQFARYGGLIGFIVGVMVVGEGVAIVALWRHNLAQQKQLQELADKRVFEVKEVNGLMVGLARENNQANAVLAHSVSSMKDAVLLRLQDRG